MTVIDAHQHFWVLAAHDQPFLRSHPSLAPLLRDFTVGELAPQAAAAGVTGTVVVQTVLEPGETPELLELAATGGLVAGVVGWADLEAPDVADAIAGLRELPGGNRLSGLRHPLLGEPDLGWLTRPAVLRGLAARAPYFHNGAAATLNEAVNFYNERFSMHLTAQQKSDLVAFLNSL